MKYYVITSLNRGERELKHEYDTEEVAMQVFERVCSLYVRFGYTLALALSAIGWLAANIY